MPEQLRVQAGQWNDWSSGGLRAQKMQLGEISEDRVGSTWRQVSGSLHFFVVSGGLGFVVTWATEVSRLCMLQWTDSIEFILLLCDVYTPHSAPLTPACELILPAGQ